MLGRKRKATDFSAEIQEHLQLEVERLREQGLSEEEAQAAAHRTFGNVTRAEERFYEFERWVWWDRLCQDLRFGLRMLVKKPGFTTVAVLTLALGIGANTGIFSLIHAVLLRPLPFPDPNRLVTLWERRPESGEANIPISGFEFVAWRDQNHTFERMAFYETGFATLTGRGEAETVMLLRVSGDFFSLWGAQPALGRAIHPGEDRSSPAPIAVLSDAFWRRSFGADAGVVGKAITLDDHAYTVIGVMPPLPKTMSPDMWLPLDLPADARKVGKHSANVVGRLKRGVMLAQAQSDVDAVARTLEQRFPQDSTNHHVKVLPMREDMAGDLQRALAVLMCAVGFVLLIACLNVTSLLLTRAAGRQREMAIRTALGASRLRLIRQLVTESVMLAGMGGSVGLLLALGLARLLPHVRAVKIPLVETMAIDGPVLAAATLLALLSGLLAGVAPALRASRPQAIHGVNQGSRMPAGPGRRRLGAGLVAAEVAFALILLIGAGLMMKSFVRLVRVDPGFNPQNLLVTSVAIPASKYPRPEQAREFFMELLQRIRAVPGVMSTGATNYLPLQGGDNWVPFSIEGRPAPAPGREIQAPFRVVTSDYFRTLGIPLQAGRFFREADRRLSVPIIRWYDAQKYPPNFNQPQPIPVAIISEAMAHQYWPNENPLGRRFRILFSPWITVVGVVGDIKHNALNAPYYPHIYLSSLQEPWTGMTVVVKTSQAPTRYAAAVRDQIRSLDADVPVTITAMDDVLSDSVGRQRFYTLLVGAFGAAGLLLAVVGIFGLTSFSVSQRTSEIGVRMALGAQRGDILQMIVGQGLSPTLTGMAAGAVGALALTGLMKNLLYDTKPVDPITFITVSFLLAAMGLIASYIPARRATKVDPMVALRYE